jgi:phage tail sheath gpL-like
MASLIVIDGLTADDKTPGGYAETKYGQGRVSIGAGAVKCLLIGYMLAAGSATVDSSVDQIFGQAEADALYGARSQLSSMAAAAFRAVGEGGVELWGAPTAEAGAAVTADIDITVGGAWSTNGWFDLYVGGRRHQIVVGATDNIAAVVARIESEIEKDPHAPWAVTDASPVATIVTQNKGAHGNQYYVAVDMKHAPAGLTVVPEGSEVAGTGGLYPMINGAGDPTMTTLLGLLEAEEYDIIVHGVNDATSLAAVEAHVDAQAISTIGHLEHVVCATNAAYATAIGLSATTLNAYRVCMLWDEYQEAHPCEWAAEFGAIRASREGTSPWQNYIGEELTAAKPKRYGPAVATHAELKAALNNGLSPVTTVNGVCKIVRPIVTHCLNGTSPDYRCYDLPDAVVPDRINKELLASWAAFAAANPSVQADPTEGENVPSGVAYPALWNTQVYSDMLTWQNENLWIMDVDEYPPTSGWDSDSKRIVTAAPCVVRPVNAQGAISVRQIAS